MSAAKFERVSEIKCWQIIHDQDVAVFIERLEVLGLRLVAVVHRADLRCHKVFFGRGADQDLDEADAALINLLFTEMAEHQA